MTLHDKLAELAVYVAERCSAHQLFGKVKLNKILFHADMFAYLETGETLSEATYTKKQFGPVPEGMEDLLSRLQDEGRITVEARQMPDGKTQQRVRALKGPNLTAFTYEQLHYIERALDRIKPLTANEISELTHLMPGWSAARMGEVIPMEASLVQRARRLSDGEQKRAEAYAAAHALV